MSSSYVFLLFSCFNPEKGLKKGLKKGSNKGVRESVKESPGNLP